MKNWTLNYRYIVNVFVNFNIVWRKEQNINLANSSGHSHDY